MGIKEGISYVLGRFVIINVKVLRDLTVLGCLLPMKKRFIIITF